MLKSRAEAEKGGSGQTFRAATATRGRVQLEWFAWLCHSIVDINSNTVWASIAKQAAKGIEQRIESRQSVMKCHSVSI